MGAAPRPQPVKARAATTRTSAANRRMGPSARDFDDDLGRLDDADRLVADAQVQLVDRFRGHEAHEAVWPGEDLDDGRDPVALDAGDDAGEAVSRGLGDDRPVRRSPA